MERLNRNLDGIYFRVKRNDKWENVCFSDMTDKEVDEVMSGRSIEWLQNMCKILGRRIREIGDELDLVCD